MGANCVIADCAEEFRGYTDLFDSVSSSGTEYTSGLADNEFKLMV